MKHRPELDGVRGVAIAGVVAYHAGELSGSWVPGGHLGVVVFFVLSGYLITSLLLAERERSGRVALGSFYRRRVFRLLPALLAGLGVVLVVRVAGGRWTHPAQVGMLLVLLYATNITLAMPGGWALADEYVWAWSLSTEEQFYALWPPLVARLSRRRLTQLAVLVVVGTWVARVVIHAHGGFGMALFAPWCRLDAMALGCLAALWQRDLSRFAAPALIAVVGCYLAFGLQSPGTFEVGMTLSAVATAVLVTATRGPVVTLLRAAPLTWLGRRSYGIYIWHAVLGADTLGQFVPMRGWVVPAWVVLSLCVAELSFRWVEQPAQRWARNRRAPHAVPVPA